MFKAVRQCAMPGSSLVQVKANDIPEFVLKPRILEDFESAYEVRLQVVSGPNLLDALMGDA